MCTRLAKIHFGAGSLPRDCTITDISDGGVKVVAEFLEVPPQFTIIFAPDYSRQCRLRWRIGCEFGAEFTDRDARPFVLNGTLAFIGKHL